jgi:hypothetical protein
MTWSRTAQNKMRIFIGCSTGVQVMCCGSKSESPLDILTYATIMYRSCGRKVSEGFSINLQLSFENSGLGAAQQCCCLQRLMLCDQKLSWWGAASLPNKGLLGKVMKYAYAGQIVQLNDCDPNFHHWFNCSGCVTSWRRAILQMVAFKLEDSNVIQSYFWDITQVSAEGPTLNYLLILLLTGEKLKRVLWACPTLQNSGFSTA